MDNYYTILELDPGAPADQIKANYRRLAMKWHPDRNGGSAEAEDRFKRISEAYSVLSEDEKRRQYDAYLSGESTQTAGRGFGRDYEGFRKPTPEEAAFMFMNEMYNLATELTLQNVSWKDIAQELTRRGCPETTAAEIALQIEKRRKTMIRANARPYFVRSALSGLFGLFLFGVFAGVGLGLLGFIGLLMFLSGAYNLVRALYFITTGKAPKR